MKRTLLLILVFLLLWAPSVLFATGQVDQTATTGGGAGEVANPGKFVIYNTLGDYTRETGNKITSFGEAPELAALAQEGKLPPVEDRISDEPQVMEPLFEIGRYGGEFRTSMMDPRIEGADSSTIHFQPLFKVDIEDFRPKPNIVKGYDMSQDGRVLTLYLRKGMKWSDGAPFTTDDFMFWYESILLNDEIMPVKPSRWAPGGDVVKMQQIDDTTVRFTFAQPYFPVLNMLAVGPSSRLQEPFSPAHYLKKWHIDHNKDAEAVAKAEGYDSWSKAFAFHAVLGTTEVRKDVDAPGVGSWVLSEIEDNGNKYFTRNPYYWKIDTAGNQLPYVDRQVAVLLQNAEVVSLKAMAGELTTAGVQVSLKNYTMYKENETKGDYTTYLWAGGKGAERVVSFNLTHPDPVLKGIFQDVRFRQAMSLAINREEMNQAIYFGRGIERQATVTPNAAFYEDWMGDYYAEFDPDRANKLLDEVGLKKGADGFRMRPDGQPLVITMGYFPLGGETGLVPELLTENWNSVGVKTVVKQYERSFYGTLIQSNEHDVGYGSLGQSSEYSLYENPHRLRPPFTNAAIAWRNWYNSSGAQGEEPPDEVKKLYDMTVEWQAQRPGTDEYMRLGKEAVTLYTRGLYNIGMIGMPPVPLMIKNNMRNTPTQSMLDKPTWTWDYRFFAPFHTDQWFFVE